MRVTSLRKSTRVYEILKKLINTEQYEITKNVVTLMYYIFNIAFKDFRKELFNFINDKDVFSTLAISYSDSVKASFVQFIINQSCLFNREFIRDNVLNECNEETSKKDYINIFKKKMSAEEENIISKYKLNDNDIYDDIMRLKYVRKRMTQLKSCLTKVSTHVPLKLQKYVPTTLRYYSHFEKYYHDMKKDDHYRDIDLFKVFAKNE